jgi:hypothetical protein
MILAAFRFEHYRVATVSDSLETQPRRLPTSSASWSSEERREQTLPVERQRTEAEQPAEDAAAMPCAKPPDRYVRDADLRIEAGPNKEVPRAVQGLNSDLSRGPGTQPRDSNEPTIQVHLQSITPPGDKYSRPVRPLYNQIDLDLQAVAGGFHFLFRRIVPRADLFARFSNTGYRPAIPPQPVGAPLVETSPASSSRARASATARERPASAKVIAAPPCYLGSA